MITNIEFYNQLKMYLSEDAKINNVELVTNDIGTYAQISYTASEREVKEGDLWYKNRIVKILLIPNQEKLNQGHSIQAIAGFADTRDDK